MALLVVSFYKFVSLPDYVELQSPLLAYCSEQGIQGTILLALEGINGTLAGSPSAIYTVLSHLRSDPRLADLEHKESFAQTTPFDRMKVRLKKEIVTLGRTDSDPTQQVGTYVSSHDWNALISDPSVTLIDTRNYYEFAIGSFKGAHNPQTQSFRQFPEYVQTHLNPDHHQRVALFCTGGIRCEKASSFMLAQGFREVYHLKGGILKYLEDVAEQESLWEGECFVFDQRVAVQQGLQLGTHRLCQHCGYPVPVLDSPIGAGLEVISCPNCGDRP